jgi:hypothetical protein
MERLRIEDFIFGSSMSRQHDGARDLLPQSPRSD